MADLVAQYLDLTKVMLPCAARASDTYWPVSADHCFQRIVLDTICGGVWYDYIAKPAYKHISTDQAQAAVALCQDILAGRVDLHALNAKSIRWRALARDAERDTSAACPKEPHQRTLDL